MTPHQAFKTLKSAQQKMANTTPKERIALLKKLKKEILVQKTAIEEALFQDYQRSPIETNLADTFVILKEINYAIGHLESWLMPKSVGTPLTLFGASSYIHHEPKGVVLIISPWNFPFNLTFSPLVSALAAGNVAIVKPSEHTPTCANLIQKIIENVFAPDQVQTFLGDASVSEALLALPFNHIFFTGSPKIGKVVMRAAANHLASVTLELGGKSPVIVDETANLKSAAEIIATTKFLNNGQVCIAGDYVLVQQSVHAAFLAELKAVTEKLFVRGNSQQNPDYARLATKNQFDHVSKMIDDALAKGAKPQNEVKRDALENFVGPLILDAVPESATVMQDEIFGPVLPVRSYQNLEEAVAYINQKPKPLALYMFTKKQKNRDFVLQNTRAGATVFNNIYLHHYNSELPFGGSNNSGIGKSHGHFGFLEFCNQRAIVRQWAPFSAMQLVAPPYTNFKIKLVDFMMRWLS